MGADIHGFIEVWECNMWISKVDADCLIPRDYDFFGVLFGVRNRTGFEPLFDTRGIPNDASFSCKHGYEEWGLDSHSPSYVTLDELLAIDKTVQAEERSDWTTGYKRQPNGELKWVTQFGWSSTISPEYDERLSNGEEIEVNGIIYKKEFLTVENALGKTYEVVIDTMQTLKKHYEKVRLVVWFDN